MSDDSKDIKVETKTVVPDLDQSSGKAVPEEDRTRARKKQGEDQNHAAATHRFVPLRRVSATINPPTAIATP